MQEQGLLSHTGTKAELSSRMPARPFVALPNSSARRDCQQSWPCSGLERCCAVPPSCRRCSASCLASKQSAGPCCAMQGFLPARSASSLSSLCEAQPRAAPAGEAPQRCFPPFLKLLCCEMLAVLLVPKSKAAKFSTSLLLRTGCHALSAASRPVLMQLSHFFPVFFFPL